MTNRTPADDETADSVSALDDVNDELADDETLSPEPPSEDSPIKGKRIAFAGKLGGLSRRDAMRLIREHSGIACDQPSMAVDIVVIGAEESPLAEGDLLSDELCEAAARGEIEVLSETEFWQRLGLVEAEQAVKRLYTPAMLADLLGVSVRVIRRWHRRGLIVPARTVHKLPYFEFQEIATARRLAELLAAGASVAAIERKLESLSQVLPSVDRPLAQLSVIIEGKQLLLRQGEGLIEPGGQLRIDFDALPLEDDPEPEANPSVLAFGNSDPEPVEEEGEIDPLQQKAFDSEDDGEFEAAIDCYHAILARDGARADISFQLAELFYRMGESWAARERYLISIELDPDFVEARASLGGLLAEMGRKELAVAAFRGALRVHDDYPDVHYNLARTLDELDREIEADHHWRRFLQLAPESPWAAAARERLNLDPEPV
ncbi:MerR family transcriptional regulator [Rosistilla oblonga]|uniref:DNA ligase n=1 Tax=Rosistilla oblonga TaxID=2527990 RepID=A0A518IZY3_9BACT|nr:MerR family transcriptional regulator [Rosistilla oblonga]QDV58653.1 DNA ligase [Rosistilla oblonga]